MSTSQGTFTIVNEKGLHARASAKFVDMVEQFDANATIEKDGIDASGRGMRRVAAATTRAPEGTQEASPRPSPPECFVTVSLECSAVSLMACSYQ